MRYVCNLTLGYADFKFKRIGRKFVHTSGLVTIILSLALVIIAYILGFNHKLKEEIRLLILLASAMTSQIYITAGIVGNELFPTPIRNIGYAFLQLWNRMGVIVSPFIFYWATTSVILPYCIMITLCLVNMLSFECLLPETKGLHLAIQMPPLEERLLKGRKYRRQDTKSGRLVASEASPLSIQ
ncbi:hypothetical protein KIN20_008011 [Parelaphostrongylus tenuis]|uniref:Major facilitator superfamily (MFS) profile domain-containing protein n=1 Tax=Parelaphostrongylus tenuis TaxID=148309 RepID=A0AAD5QME5_PARTN|nr:hypothetical protein KIN20_008011 [Parelaphostrongylus tenuis]